MNKHIKNYNLSSSILWQYRNVGKFYHFYENRFWSRGLIIHQVWSKVNVDMGEQGLIEGKESEVKISINLFV